MCSNSNLCRRDYFSIRLPQHLRQLYSEKVRVFTPLFFIVIGLCIYSRYFDCMYCYYFDFYFVVRFFDVILLCGLIFWGVEFHIAAYNHGRFVCFVFFSFALPFSSHCMSLQYLCFCPLIWFNWLNIQVAVCCWIWLWLCSSFAVTFRAEFTNVRLCWIRAAWHMYVFLLPLRR